jgi:hypothetical protein
VSNKIVQALEDAASRVGKKLSQDGAKAVSDMYKDAGSKTKDVIKRITDADDEHSKKLVSLAGRLAKNDAKTVTTASAQEAKQTMDNSLRKGIRNILGGEGEDFDHVAVVDSTRFPESAQHIQEAQAGKIWSGGDVIEDDPMESKPSILTIDRGGADANRTESLRGISTAPGMDRDEYPMAMFSEGGAGASVKHITSSDNQAAGASVGGQLRGIPDGAKVKIVIK